MVMAVLISGLNCSKSTTLQGGYACEEINGVLGNWDSSEGRLHLYFSENPELFGGYKITIGVPFLGGYEQVGTFSKNSTTIFLTPKPSGTEATPAYSCSYQIDDKILSLTCNENAPSELTGTYIKLCAV